MHDRAGLAALPQPPRVPRAHPRRSGRRPEWVRVLASWGAIASLVGTGHFPRRRPSRTDLADSLTIMNASSTERTLTTMLVIAAIGVPIVLACTIVIYRVFKGRVKLGEHAY